MYTTAALLDLHERTHRSLQALIAHCGGLSEEDRNREVPGFGVPTVHQQLHHAIMAESYWMSVLAGDPRWDAEPEDHPSTEALEALRAEVFARTVEILSGLPEEELDTVKGWLAFGGQERQLSPAQGVLRTQTHFFHHQGQVLAMCRLLGHPGGGMDFPMG